MVDTHACNTYARAHTRTHTCAHTHARAHTHTHTFAVLSQKDCLFALPLNGSVVSVNVEVGKRKFQTVVVSKEDLADMQKSAGKGAPKTQGPTLDGPTGPAAVAKTPPPLYSFKTPLVV